MRAWAVVKNEAPLEEIELPTPELLAVDEQEAIPPTELLTNAPPMTFPDEAIPAEAQRYEALALSRNWRFEGGQALVGGGGVGYAPFGQAAMQFSDVLGDQMEDLYAVNDLVRERPAVGNHDRGVVAAGIARG